MDTDITPRADKLMAPISNHHLFFCGFHVAKKNPKFQVTTMHYCGMRGEGDQTSSSGCPRRRSGRSGSRQWTARGQDRPSTPRKKSFT